MEHRTDEDRIAHLIDALEGGERHERLDAARELAGYGAEAYRARDALLTVMRQAGEDDELFRTTLQAAGAVAMARGRDMVEATETLIRAGDALAEDAAADSDPLGEAAFMFGAAFLAGALYLADAIYDGMGMSHLIGSVAGSVLGTWTGARLVRRRHAFVSWLGYTLGGAAGVLVLVLAFTTATGDRASVRPALAAYGAIVGFGVRLIVRGRRGWAGMPPPEASAGPDA